MGGSGTQARFRNPATGASFTFGVPLPPGIGYQVSAGFLLPDDGSEIAAEPAEPGRVARPRRNGSHAAWILYAADQGMDRADAGRLSRAELIERLSPAGFDPQAAPEGRED